MRRRGSFSVKVPSLMLQVFCGIPPELLPPKGSQKGAKGSQKGAKGSQKGAKGSQKGAKDQENHQKSCLGAFEVFFVFSLSFFLQNCKNGHGALVGIT